MKNKRQTATSQWEESDIADITELARGVATYAEHEARKACLKFSPKTADRIREAVVSALFKAKDNA